MSLNISYLQVKAQINDFLCSYLVAPKAYSEILFAVLHHFDDKMSSMSKSEADLFSQEVTSHLLKLIASGYLVTYPAHVGMYCLNQEFQSLNLVENDHQSTSLQNITQSQFFEYLKSLAQIYEVSNGCFAFAEQYFEPNNAHAFDQCFIEQIFVRGFDFDSEDADDLNADSSGDRVLVKHFASDFSRFNLARGTNERFIIGLPLIVKYNSAENQFTYIPVFYYSISEANFLPGNLVMLNCLTGPFINQAFLDEIDEIFFANELVFTNRDLVIAARKEFLSNVERFLASNQGSLAEFSGLVSCLVQAYGKFCDFMGKLSGNFNTLKSPELLKFFKNKIGMGAILSVASHSSYKQQSIADLKAMITAGPEALQNTALKCFFTADLGFYTPNFQPQELPVFNTFSPESKAAVVVDIDAKHHCDEDQRAAVRSMLRNEVTVLQCPPKTDKRNTVATAAYNHLIRGQTVLVTSSDQQAVNDFLDSTDSNQGWSWATGLQYGSYNSALKLHDLVADLVNRINVTWDADLYSFLQPLSNFAKDLAQQEKVIADNEELRHLWSQVLNQLQSSLDITVDQIVKIYLDSNGKVSFPLHVAHLFKKVFGNTLKGKLPNLNFNIEVATNATEYRKWLQWIDDLIDALQALSKADGGEKATSDFEQFWGAFTWPFFKNQAVYTILGCERLIYLLNQVKAVAALKLEVLQLAEKCQVELTSGHEDKVEEECNKNIQALAHAIVPDDVKEHIRGLGFHSDPVVCASAVTELQNFYSGNTVLPHEQDKALFYVQKHFPITATSLLQVGETYPLKPGIFDLVIFDEATQCSFIDALPVMYRAKRIAIIGDPMQFKPMGWSNTSIMGHSYAADQLSSIIQGRFNITSNLFDFVRLGCACFDGKAQNFSGAEKYLDFAVPYAQQKQHMDVSDQDDEHSIPSNLRYLEPMLLRRNLYAMPAIVDYISSSFYADKLIAGRDENTQKVKVLHKIAGERYKPGVHFVHIDSEILSDRDNFSRTFVFSKDEIDLTLQMVEDIVNRAYKGSIGIMSPFWYHLDRLRQFVTDSPSLALRNALKSGQIRIGTSNMLQGVDCDIVIYNLCLDAESSIHNQLALDPNVFNLTLSKAKDFLFIVGNYNAVLNYQHKPFMYNLARYVSNNLKTPAQQSPIAQTSADIRRLTANVKVRFDNIWEKKLYKELVELLDADPQLADVDYSLVTQLEYYNYRLDIALISGEVGLNIECDGSQHYKHWYSLQEYVRVDSDKQRDDLLQAAQPLSFKTIRFKNSLIDDNPRQCAKQVVNTFKSILPQA